MYLIDHKKLLKLRNKLLNHKPTTNLKSLNPLPTALQSRSQAVNNKRFIQQIGILVQLDSHEDHGDFPAHAG